MESPITGHDATGRDDTLVHNWRVSQLTRLGIPSVAARCPVPLACWPTGGNMPTRTPLTPPSCHPGNGQNSG